MTLIYYRLTVVAEINVITFKMKSSPQTYDKNLCVNLKWLENPMEKGKR